MTHRLGSAVGQPARRALGRLALAAGLLLAGVGSPEGAAARTMQQRLELACAGPIDHLCATARPDSDAINACLLSHRDELPPECAKLVEVAG